MEYAEGGNLSHKIENKRSKGEKFTTDEILRYIAQITLALMVMHSKNILHRNIKAQNILVCKNDILKLDEFGILKQMDARAMNARQYGIPYNISPEVIESVPYNFKAEVWALGVIMYELITFKKPFEGDTMNEFF